MHTVLTPDDGGPVIVGMSGGVDSAVAALLLKEAGFTVQGLFMSNWDDDGYCTAAEDFQDARRVCDRLDIPLHRVSFAAEYRERVFAHFLREYASGRTPNPDVLCNREIKFGVCLEYMHRLGASWVATGHYARLRREDGQVRLVKALDQGKDQSYFLHQVAPAALARALFPIGELRKDEVRRRAHAAGLPVFDKPDSTGICFIGERPFDEFLSSYLRQTPGPIENSHGEVLGDHRGLALYTLGQRSGLGIGGRAGAAAAPWYVAGKDMLRNVLIVVQDPDHPLLLSDSFEVEDVPTGARSNFADSGSRMRGQDPLPSTRFGVHDSHRGRCGARGVASCNACGDTRAICRLLPWRGVLGRRRDCAAPQLAARGQRGPHARVMAYNRVFTEGS
jgi:tRNA-specific 2-thiouridylase